MKPHASPLSVLTPEAGAGAPPPVLLGYQRRWIEDGAQLKVAEKGRRAKLRCECKVGDTLVLEGEAEVKIPGRPIA